MVYGLGDTDNYAEVVFSPNGTATLRRAINGAITNVISTSYSGGGRGVWFDAEVEYGEGFTKTQRQRHRDPAAVAGPARWVCRPRHARRDCEIRQGFARVPLQGTAVQGDVHNRPDARVVYERPMVRERRHVQHLFGRGHEPGESWGSGIALRDEGTLQYTLRARMLNPYGGPGNLVGIQFHVGGTGGRLGEVVFSPRGVAQGQSVLRRGESHGRDGAVQRPAQRLVRCARGRRARQDRESLSTASSCSTRVDFSAPSKATRGWSRIGRPANSTTSGTTQFDLPPALGNVRRTVAYGLGTAAPGIRRRHAQRHFASQTDIVATSCGCWNTDIRYRARLLNQFGASGNLVGLVYNYQRSARLDLGDAYPGLYVADYYEVVFAPTGQAFMNKVPPMAGSYRVATATHSGARAIPGSTSSCYGKDRPRPSRSTARLSSIACRRASRARAPWAWSRIGRRRDSTICGLRIGRRVRSSTVRDESRALIRQRDVQGRLSPDASSFQDGDLSQLPAVPDDRHEALAGRQNQL